MQAGQPLDAQPVAHRVEGAVRPAVGVPDGDAVVAAAQLADHPLDLAGDPLGAVVEQRRQRVDVHRPAVPRDDVGGRLGDGAARDERHPRACGVPELTPGRRAGRRSGR